MLQQIGRMLLAISGAILLLTAGPAGAEVTGYLFWQEGCPHCASAKEALSKLQTSHPELRLVEIEIGASDENADFFRLAVDRAGLDTPAIPLLVIGGNVVVGFSDAGGSAGIYRRLVEECRETECANLLDIVGREPGPMDLEQNVDLTRVDLPDSIDLPWIGDVRLAQLSLPLLTVTLAAVDGFNPCAMWVLAILIGFLIGVEDTRRMWTLGAVFLAATALMYFAVMAAWLNVILWIGALSWLRFAIGGVAVVSGGYYLHEYWTNPEGVCRVTPSSHRKRITDRFRSLVEEPSLLLASLGIAALAIGVNLIELVCSAGVPTIFTQTLAMHDLSLWTTYGYLLLYIGVFLLDDAVLLITALVLLKSVSTTGRLTRVSHLIGGSVLVCLGLVMLLRPDLLT